MVGKRVNYRGFYSVTAIAAILCGAPATAERTTDQPPSTDKPDTGSASSSSPADAAAQAESKAERLKAAASAPMIRALPDSPERAAIDARKAAADAAKSDGWKEPNSPKSPPSQDRRAATGSTGNASDGADGRGADRQSTPDRQSASSTRDRDMARSSPPRSYAPPPRSAAPSRMSGTDTILLRAGTPVRMRLVETVTTKHGQAKVGQMIAVEAAAPVIIGNVELISEGTQGWAEITSVRKKGMWGKSGHIEARATHLRAYGKSIHLTGNFNDRGTTGTAGVAGVVALGVVASPVVPLAGFLITGTSATLPKGGQFTAYVADDTNVPLASANRVSHNSARGTNR